jgi:hypothetical protein
MTIVKIQKGLERKRLQFAVSANFKSKTNFYSYHYQNMKTVGVCFIRMYQDQFFSVKVNTRVDKIIFQFRYIFSHYVI